MKIRQIIAAADMAKPNDFEEELKVRWIAELDGKIAADVFLMGYSELKRYEYTHPESLDTEPLVTFPHDDIYRLWLMSKIDLANGEYKNYQNTMMAYNESYGNFVRWFARVWRPAQGNSGCLVVRDDVPQYYITAYGLAVRSGFTGTLEDWLESLRGEKGEPGMSAYAYALAGGFIGTEEDFIHKLTHDGKTAWEYAVEGGFEGTEEEYTALVAQIPETQKNVEFCSGGYSAKYHLYSGGWKRVAVLDRSNSGIVELSLRTNYLNVGRSFQNIMLGFSGFVDFPTVKNGGVYSRLSNAEGHPRLFQILNHTYGESPDTTDRHRIYRISKVRIAYPKNYDEIEGGEDLEYRKPVNIYLDVYVDVDPNVKQELLAEDHLRLTANLTGHTKIDRNYLITEETNCTADPATGAVIGEFAGVLCDTYEMDLVEGFGFVMNEPAQFDTLAVSKLCQTKERTYTANSDHTIDGEPGTKFFQKINVDLTPREDATVLGDQVYLQPVCRNMIVDAAPRDGSRSGLTIIKYGNGVYHVDGTATATFVHGLFCCNGSVKGADYECAIILHPGKTYVVYDAQVMLADKEAWLAAKAAGNHSYTNTELATTTYIGMDSARLTPAAVTIPASDTERVVIRAGIFIKGGNTYAGRVFYPQLVEQETDLVKVEEYTGNGTPYAVQIPFPPYSPKYGIIERPDVLEFSVDMAGLETNTRNWRMTDSRYAKQIQMHCQGYDVAAECTVKMASEMAQKIDAASDINGVVPVYNGGTGATTAEQALANLGAAPKGLISHTIYLNQSNRDLDDQLASIYESMTGNTSRGICIVDNAGSVLGGGSWQGIMSKASSDYGSIIVWKYGGQAGFVYIKTRSLTAGKWMDWITLTTGDTVLTSANWSDYIDISGANGGGLTREFHAENINSGYYRYEGVLARLYTVAVSVNAVAGYPLLSTFTFDYYALSTKGTLYFDIQCGEAYVKVTLESGAVSFETTPASFSLYSIAGYY